MNIDQAPAIHATRSACMRWLASISMLLLLLLPVAGSASVLELTRGWVLPGATSTDMPPGPDANWSLLLLPNDAVQSPPETAQQPLWLRLDFERPTAVTPDAPPWGVYLPYFYWGGSIWLNGVLLARVPIIDENVFARSYQPRLITLPAALLREGHNEVALHAAASGNALPAPLSSVIVGPLDQVQPLFERRQFWARAVPQMTVFGSVLVAGFMLLIWWRRPDEILYGLFSVAAVLWGIRSITFLIDVLPWQQWDWWRVLFQCATGGFVIAMALFSLRLARLNRPRMERALIGYGLIGPLWLAFVGFSADTAVGRWWLGGMMIVGIVIIVVTLPALARQKKLLTATLRVTMVLTVLFGIHDYLLTWHPSVLARVLPEWTGHRIFLLHLGTSAMLLTMGGLLTARFIKSLAALEDLNRTLESRVADREQQLATNFERLAELQRQHAAAEERQAIMRDLHDGLGSQLFTSLLRVERGDMDSQQIASALRACIADMRLALDTLASRDNDLGAALGDFMFRWQSQLAAAGVESQWRVDLPNHATTLAPHAALQVLRIAQESLTNVLKHAQATRVQVRLAETTQGLELRIEDDGVGLPSTPSAHEGHGLGNMRLRAHRLGGTIDLRGSAAGGTVMVLTLPWQPASAPTVPAQPLQAAAADLAAIAIRAARPAQIA